MTTKSVAIPPFLPLSFFVRKLRKKCRKIASCCRCEFFSYFLYINKIFFIFPHKSEKKHSTNSTILHFLAKKSLKVTKWLQMNPNTLIQKNAIFFNFFALLKIFRTFALFRTKNRTDFQPFFTLHFSHFFALFRSFSDHFLLISESFQAPSDGIILLQKRVDLPPDIRFSKVSLDLFLWEHSSSAAIRSVQMMHENV